MSADWSVMYALQGQSFFHRQQSGAREVASEDLLLGALTIYKGRIRNAGIMVDERFQAKACIFCLEGEIRQVLNNLIGNAVDAMNQGGRLVLHSADARDTRTGRRGVNITVANTGSGIDRTTLKRIFEPFFTTKGFGGTGLGLWISKEIIERHEGRLLVRSSTKPEHHGTVFTLFLPLRSSHA